jgi:hypothetical protein
MPSAMFAFSFHLSGENKAKAEEEKKALAKRRKLQQN